MILPSRTKMVRPTQTTATLLLQGPVLTILMAAAAEEATDHLPTIQMMVKVSATGELKAIQEPPIVVHVAGAAALVAVVVEEIRVGAI